MNSASQPDLFSKLVTEHQAALRAFIRSLGTETASVDDVAQEVLLIAYQKYPEFDTELDFGRWLRGIARKVVANKRRKDARRARNLSGHTIAQSLEEQSSETLEDPVEAARLLAAMNACIALLSERNRNMLNKRYVGLDNSSTLSSHFKMSPEAIRQNLLRSRAWVRQCVNDKLAMP